MARGRRAACVADMVRPDRTGATARTDGVAVPRADHLSADVQRAGAGDRGAGSLRTAVGTSADAKPSPSVHADVRVHRRLDWRIAPRRSSVALGGSVRA